MRPVPFGNLIKRVFGELKGQKSVFGIPKERFCQDCGTKSINIFHESCTMPLGPAAGPHTQLAQNIITSYLVGARFVELKTCQVMDHLEIAKPCIDARDECYNAEWSTEYTLEKAFEEYLKAWLICHMFELLKEGDSFEKPSFIFNMSVGYNLEGIKTEKMQNYIHSMLDSDRNGAFTAHIEEMKRLLEEGILDGTEYEGKEDRILKNLGKISKAIAPSVTISTMHGCPPKEIEAICTYMLTEKKVDTFVKLNPTLLGYDEARSILDNLGFDYLHLKRESFEKDLQYKDAVSMLSRLIALAKKEGRCFGVKLTNTLGSVNDQGVLPGDEMYMSGRLLLPLSTTVALKLSKEFGGELPISYSGGANAGNVKELFECGIHPITVATEMLKPGGYMRLTQMASEVLSSESGWGMTKIDVKKLEALNKKARDPENGVTKERRGTYRVKIGTPNTICDCFVAPCVEACPIHQDIPEYVQLMGEGKYAEALAVIYGKNALPSITGWICDHQCQNHCSRLDYEGAVQIRELKKLAREHGYKEYIDEIWSKPEEPADVKAAVIGAGPAGLAAALFLRRAGFDTEIFERERNAGGVVRNVIPEFRIPVDVVEADVEYILAHGVKAHWGVKPEDVTVEKLKKEGFGYLFYACGAEKENAIRLEGEIEKIDAIKFLSLLKAGERPEVGKSVIVCGGGNTAMDAARAAKRLGADVTVVYRRSLSEMPADKDEYKLALADGCSFKFLSNPKSAKDGILTLDEMDLGEKDKSGRRKPVVSGRTFSLPCSLLITATGEKADGEALSSLGLKLNEKGYPLSDAEDCVYVVGDVATGPSTVVRTIASARKAVDEAIDDCLGKMGEGEDECDDEECSCHEHGHDDECSCGCHDHDHGEDDGEELSDEELEEAEDKYFADLKEKKSTLHYDRKNDAVKDFESFIKGEAKRCMECSCLCTKCVEVCPNRANVALDMRSSGLFDDPFQILHIDAYCNECGNCDAFCPHDGAPYKAKFTLFSRRDDFESSENSGFLVEGDEVTLRISGEVKMGHIDKERNLEIDASDEILAMISEVFISYPYLLNEVGE